MMAKLPFGSSPGTACNRFLHHGANGGAFETPKSHCPSAIHPFALDGKMQHHLTGAATPFSHNAMLWSMMTNAAATGNGVTPSAFNPMCRIATAASQAAATAANSSPDNNSVWSNDQNPFLSLIQQQQHSSPASDLPAAISAPPNFNSFQQAMLAASAAAAAAQVQPPPFPFPWMMPPPVQQHQSPPSCPDFNLQQQTSAHHLHQANLMRYASFLSAASGGLFPPPPHGPPPMPLAAHGLLRAPQPCSPPDMTQFMKLLQAFSHQRQQQQNFPSNNFSTNPFEALQVQPQQQPLATNAQNPHHLDYPPAAITNSTNRSSSSSISTPTTAADSLTIPVVHPGSKVSTAVTNFSTLTTSTALNPLLSMVNSHQYRSLLTATGEGNNVAVEALMRAATATSTESAVKRRNPSDFDSENLKSTNNDVLLPQPPRSVNSRSPNNVPLPVDLLRANGERSGRALSSGGSGRPSAENDEFDDDRIDDENEDDNEENDEREISTETTRNGAKSSVSTNSNGADGTTSASKKTRRRRTAFTSQQLIELEQEFGSKKYLNLTDRATIAKSLNLSEVQVKIWFQNKRAKFKRTRRGGPPSFNSTFVAVNSVARATSAAVAAAAATLQPTFPSKSSTSATNSSSLLFCALASPLNSLAAMAAQNARPLHSSSSCNKRKISGDDAKIFADDKKQLLSLNSTCDGSGRSAGRSYSSEFTQSRLVVDEGPPVKAESTQMVERTERTGRGSKRPLPASASLDTANNSKHFLSTKTSGKRVPEVPIPMPHKRLAELRGGNNNGAANSSNAAAAAPRNVCGSFPGSFDAQRNITLSASSAFLPLADLPPLRSGFDNVTASNKTRFMLDDKGVVCRIMHPLARQSDMLTGFAVIIKQPQFSISAV